jgi:oligogalacturonide lyase
VRRLALVVALLLPLAAGAQSAPVLETGSQQPMPAEWIDRATGHRVVRLSRREGSNESFYFHNDPFVPRRAAAGGVMVFSGSTPNGRQLFTVDLASLALAQVTDRAGGVSGEIVAPKHREVVYQRGDSVFATHLHTKRTRLLVALPAGLHANVTTLNADETLLGGVIAGPEVRAILAQYPAKRDFFDRIFAAHPLHTLFVVDLKSGELRKIHEEKTWIGHVQFSPTDPTLLMFCHEGPWHLVDRIWTIDVKSGEVRQIHHRTVDREIAGHEFFSPDGRTIWYDLQIPRGETFFLAGTDVATGKTVKYQMTRDEWSIHFNQSPDGSLFAGDGGDSSQVARAKDGRWLYLFRPQGDRLVSEKLVDMHAHGYKLEPNVHFSPDGKWITFRANFEGQSEAYAVAVAREQLPRDPNASARAALVQPAKRDALPTIFYIGDSTVRNGDGTGSNGQWGWGDLTASYFDTTRVHVVNRALGGRSSRTFISQGHWDAVLAQLRQGDVVLMQFGHNDASPVNDTSRARGTIHGVGDETQEIENGLTHQHETVHSYGWYLRKLIADTRAKGATPVVVSSVPQDAWDGDKVRRGLGGFAGWAEQVARAERVPFLDLNELIAREYDALGPDKVHAFFPSDHTHTNREGAALSARVAVDALRRLPDRPVAKYLR